MGKHIITISDEEGGVSVRMEGQGRRDTTAGFMANALSEVLPGLVADAARKAAAQGQCPCLKCAAKRNGQAAHTEPKPTLH